MRGDSVSATGVTPLGYVPFNAIEIVRGSRFVSKKGSVTNYDFGPAIDSALGTLTRRDFDPAHSRIFLVTVLAEYNFFALVETTEAIRTIDLNGVPCFGW